MLKSTVKNLHKLKFLVICEKEDPVSSRHTDIKLSKVFTKADGARGENMFLILETLS